MRNLNFLKIIFLLALCSCNLFKEEEPQLPPETQTGANTFGCYVNGELFVREGIRHLGEPNPRAVYSRSNEILGISAYQKKSGIYLYITIHKPKEKSDNLEFDMYYRDYEKEIIIESKKEENISGEIYFTKFDTINKISSGYFSNIKLYYFQENSVIKDSVLINQGRFDIKSEIYND